MKKRILCLAIALCMIAALLPATALAEDVKRVQVLQFCTTTGDWTNYYVKGWNNTNLSYTYYAKLSSDGKQMDWSNATASDYNIAIKQTGAELEITLNNAYMQLTTAYYTSIRVLFDGHVTLRLLGTNEIKHTKHNSSACVYIKASEGVTVTGGGSLKAYTSGFSSSGGEKDFNGDGVKDKPYNYSSVLIFEGDTLIENVTLNLTQDSTSTGPWHGQGIRCSGNLTIDNSTLNINTEFGSAIHIGPTRTGLDAAGKNVVIRNGSKLNLHSQNVGAVREDYFQLCATIRIGSGNIYIDAANGTEVTLKGQNFVFNKTPILTGNYAAMIDTSKDGNDAVEYAGEGGVATTKDQYRYFHLEETEPELSTPIVAPALNNSLDMNVGIPKTDVGADGYAMFVPADGGEAIKVDLTDVEGGYFVATLPDLAAKQMTDAYTVTIYGADDKAASTERTVSVVDYAIGQLRDEKNANNVAFKTLLVDMLVYGAMAQTQFGYNTDKLAIADLTPEELALATGNMQVCENGLQAAAGYKGTTFILESSIEMATAFDKAVVGEGAYAIVTFENHKGEQVTSEKIYETAKYSNTYNAVFISDDLAAADGRCKVTWTIYNAEGAAVLSIVDSLESYTKRAMDAGDDFVEKLMIYSDSAKAFFLANV